MLIHVLVFLFVLCSLVCLGAPRWPQPALIPTSLHPNGATINLPTDVDLEIVLNVDTMNDTMDSQFIGPGQQSFDITGLRPDSEVNINFFLNDGTFDASSRSSATLRFRTPALGK